MQGHAEPVTRKFAPREARPTHGPRPTAAAVTPGLRPRTRRPSSPMTSAHLAALLERSSFVIDHALADPALAPIDHVAVAASGVWVITARPTNLQRVSVRRSFRHAARLCVGTTDRSDLIALLDGQRTAVCGALADHPHVPVHTAICFPGGEFPLLGSLSVGGHAVRSPRQLADEVAHGGPLRRSECRELASLLAQRLS